jgi:hypothetical protein
MSSSPDYTPPKVWTWNKANGGQFANINRPDTGMTLLSTISSEPLSQAPARKYQIGHTTCRRAPPGGRLDAIPMRLHVLTQYRIDAALVALSRFLEETQHVRI